MRNYILMILDTVLYTNAMTFISINSVIPYFLNNIGASTLLISLACALPSIGPFITQPVFSRMTLRQPYKIRIFIKILLLQRLIFLVFIFFIPFFATRSHVFLAVAFLFFWGLFNLFVGSYGTFYTPILRKLIPDDQRGRMIGVAGALGNLIAVFSSVLVGWLLSKLPFPYSYCVIFTLGVIVLLLDVLDFKLMVEDEADTVVDTHAGYFRYFLQVPGVLRSNRKYALMVLGYCFFVLTNISLSYYSLFAIRSYQAGPTQIAIFTGITVVGSILAYSVFGNIADRLGYQHVLRLSALCGLAGSLIVLTLSGILPVYAAFALSTICMTGYNLSCSIFIIQETPKDRMPLYISVNTMITLVVSATVTILSGVVIDHLSFTPVFVMTAAAGFGALLVFLKIDRRRPTAKAGER